MTRVQGPMFSVTASGTIGDAIVYTNWKGLPYVRSRVIPKNPQTGSQVSMRATFTAGVSCYQSQVAVSAQCATSWDYYASGTGMSGFNRFIMKFIELNPQREPEWEIPEVDHVGW